MINLVWQLTRSGWAPIAKISFMTYLVHMDIQFTFFRMQASYVTKKTFTLNIFLSFFQEFPVAWTMLTNVHLFFGNLAAALLFGFVTSIAWEVPLAKLQKIAMAALAAHMARKPFPKWTLVPFLLFISVLLLMLANFVLHLIPATAPALIKS